MTLDFFINNYNLDDFDIKKIYIKDNKLFKSKNIEVIEKKINELVIKVDNELLDLYGNVEILK